MSISQLPGINLIDILHRRAQYDPDKKAYIFLLDGETNEAHITYAELDTQARRIAAGLRQHVEPGARAILLFQPGLEYITAIFGCFYAGIVAVPAYPPRLNQNLERIETIIADAQVTMALTTTPIFSSLQRKFADHTAIQHLNWLVVDDLAEEAADFWTEKRIMLDAPALLQYTSGSTGDPKGVIISHENIMQNAALIQEGMEQNEETRCGSWLPPYHDMGLIGSILEPVYLGALSIFMAPATFLQQPLRWLRMISRYNITTSGGPNFAFDLCMRSMAKATPEQLSALDLSSWRVAYTGAEPVRQETLERFAQTFAPMGFRREAFYPCYGMAETTLFVSGGRKSEIPLVRSVDISALEAGRIVEGGVTAEQSRSLVSCGYTRAGQQVVIVDPELQTKCASDQVGEIWIAGPNVAQGYWGKTQETARTFQAYISDSREGPFLRTGDLGFLADGELFITGRLKDIIIIRGRNLYPQDIELVVEQSHPALRQSCCAAFAVSEGDTEQLIIVQEVARHYEKWDVQEIIQSIRSTIATEFDVEVTAIELLRAGTIYKTSSGKVQRRACRQGFLEGTLSAVHRWRLWDEDQKSALVSDRVQEQGQRVEKQGAAIIQEQEIISWLVAHIAKRAHLAVHAVDIHAPLVQYGLGSLDVVGLSGELEQWLGRPLSPTLVYDYPSIAALARYIAGKDQANDDPISAAPARETEQEPIAIIGMACRFPGANDPEEFWQFLCSGGDGIQEVPKERWNLAAFYDPTPATPEKMATRWGGFLSQIDHFDANFFGISQREATRMDPQQRLLLEVTWEAFEHAGLVPGTLAESQTGVFIGASSNDYYLLHHTDPQYHSAYAGTGNAHSIIANRISYFFDLHGPSMTLDTACSSSLVAVHQACQSLHAGDCSLAIVGGVNVILAPELSVTFSQARMMASDGHCKTFDAQADGYVRSEGCGVVLLKPLAKAKQDGDNIYAIVRGSAVNQDGASNGLTAPNGLAQEKVIRQALRKADVMPNQIAYVEMHGTGTPLGDPIEGQALKTVLMASRSPEQTCVLGAVKTNIGHLEAAAGIAGLIKTVLILQHGEIPPNLHFSTLNPYIPFEATPFVLPTTCLPWPSIYERRLAGVSAFGFGGTNAHIILEAAPIEEGNVTNGASVERSHHILTLSASSEAALQQLALRYMAWMERHPAPSLADMGFTMATGRQQFPHRLAITVSTQEQLYEHLAAVVAGTVAPDICRGVSNEHTRPKIAFLFTGQGSQYVGMARLLYETQPTFRRELDRCAQILQSSLIHPLLSIIYLEPGNGSLLHDTAYAQPALFAIEYALVMLWRSWGVKPAIVMGHSVGEYVAACVAGMMSLEEGLSLVAIRGRLMQALPEQGAMIAVFASLLQLEGLLEPFQKEVAIAAFNGPQHIVLSGAAEALRVLTQQIEAQGIETHPLAVSQAFHSPLLEPMLDAFAQAAQAVQWQTTHLPLVSNLTGDLLPVGERFDAHYWRQQTREPVQFARGMQTLKEHGCTIILEIGPQSTLTTLGKRCLPEYTGHWLFSLHRERNNWQTLLQSVAVLFTCGVQLDWVGFDNDYQRHRMILPFYAFERQSYWFKSFTAPAVQALPSVLPDSEPGEDNLYVLADDGTQIAAIQELPLPHDIQSTNEAAEGDGQLMGDYLYKLQWKATGQPPLLEKRENQVPQKWLLLLDQQGVGQQLHDLLVRSGHRSVCVTHGTQFCQLSDDMYQIDVADPQAFTSLLRIEHERDPHVFTGIVHLWSLDTTPSEIMNEQTLLSDQELSAGSALMAMKAFIADAIEPFPRLWFVTRGVHPVGDGQRHLSVSQAPLWGLGKTFAMEHPELWGGLIDLDVQDTDQTAAEQIWQCVLSERDEDQLVYRQGIRHVARLVRSQDQANVHPLVVQPDASYLITGGLQGVGLLIARWLVAHGARYIVLIGRTQLLPRPQWPQLKPGDPLLEKIAAIRELEALGANVQYAAVDVANRIQLTALLTTLTLLGYPALRGIVHAASIWQDQAGHPLVRPIISLTTTALYEVFRPKVLGSWLLYTLLKDTPLDFFVSFSSGASLVGSATQGNYAAAGEFLDVLASYQRAHGQPALSIDWGAIADVGFGATAEGQRVHSYWETHGIQRLTPAQVQSAFSFLLPPQLARIGVMKLDWTQLKQSFPHLINQPLFRSMVDEQTQNELAAGNEIRVASAPILQRLREARPEQHLRIVEDHLRTYVAHVLEQPVAQIDTQRSLISMGLDSLMALELKQRLESEFGVHIPITNFLRGPSIEQFAQQLLTLIMESEQLATTNKQEESHSIQHREGHEQQQEVLLTQIQALSPHKVEIHSGQIVSIQTDQNQQGSSVQRDTRQTKIDALRKQLNQLSKTQIDALLDQFIDQQ